MKHMHIKLPITMFYEIIQSPCQILFRICLPNFTLYQLILRMSPHIFVKTTTKKDMVGNNRVSHRFSEFPINHNFSAYGEIKHNSTVHLWLSQKLAPPFSTFIMKKQY